VRIRSDGEILLIDRIGYLDCLALTTIIIKHKEITLVTDWKFAQGLPGIGATYVWRLRT
jgi:hypothetical protein